MQQVFRDALGFAGCELVRRTLGLAKVSEIAGIPDEAARALIEVRTLRLAEALLLGRDDFQFISEVIDLAQECRTLTL